jgi:hypothetical protein
MLAWWINAIYKFALLSQEVHPLQKEAARVQAEYSERIDVDSARPSVKAANGVRAAENFDPKRKPFDQRSCRRAESLGGRDQELSSAAEVTTR